MEEPNEAAPTLDRRTTAEDDYLTVTLLASGLAGIIRQRSDDLWGGEVPGLLPDSWRVAFARLWWRFTEQHVTPLENDLALLKLCTEPFAMWPVRLALSEIDSYNALLHGEELSLFAEQAARLGKSDVEAEWVENRLHQALRRAAEENGGNAERIESAYALLRRFIIDHPVLTDNEIRGLERRFGACDANGQTFVRALINAAYLGHPISGPYQYRRCPQCRNTLGPVGAACETVGCAGGVPEEVTVSALAMVYEYHRATRRYIHDPGLVECRIFDAITTSKELTNAVRAVLFAGVDAVDVLVEFLDPPQLDDSDTPRVLERWGVDAKDHASARLLGRGFTWPQDFDCDERFLALPTHRAEQVGYVEDLEVELEGRVRVTVVSEGELLLRIKRRAKRLGW